MRCPAMFFSATAIVLATTLLPPAEAGGPLRFTNTGPIIWDTTKPITYQIDRGKLGPIDEATVQASIKTAFKTWSDVTSAAIKFKFDRLLSDDVATFADYLIATNNETGGNVIILDDDGDIIAEGFGEENRSRIFGFAMPVVTGNNITAFYSLMNGRLAESAESFLSTLIHEFGHSIGLDHAQIQFVLASDGNKTNDRFIPTMYPTSSDDDRERATLNPDDVAWVSFLYPASTFNTAFGQIKGRLVRPVNGMTTPVQGANIIAVFQGTNENSRLIQFSCVSDFLSQNNGEFVIPAVPGTYRLHIEPILLGFTGPSSVGPHSLKSTDPSFVNPVDPSDPSNTFIVTAGAVTNVGDVSAD